VGLPEFVSNGGLWVIVFAGIGERGANGEETNVE
jgi:hypothetical protein